MCNAKGTEPGSTGTMSTFQSLPLTRPSRGGSIVDPQRWMQRYKEQLVGIASGDYGNEVTSPLKVPLIVRNGSNLGNDVTSPLKVPLTIRNGSHLDNSKKLFPVALDKAVDVDDSLPGGACEPANPRIMEGSLPPPIKSADTSGTGSGIDCKSKFLFLLSCHFSADYCI